LFGTLALITKPLPRWNGLPIIAGVGFPAFFLYSAIAGTMNETSFLSQFAILVLIVTIQFIALVILGYMLQADVTDDIRTSQQGQPA